MKGEWISPLTDAGTHENKRTGEVLRDIYATSYTHDDKYIYTLKIYTHLLITW